VKNVNVVLEGYFFFFFFVSLGASLGASFGASAILSPPARL
jgi:hypothetical protein